jgi:hypothetical protein
MTGLFSISAAGFVGSGHDDRGDRQAAGRGESERPQTSDHPCRPS